MDDKNLVEIHVPVLRLTLNNGIAVAADTSFTGPDRDILNIAAIMVHAGVRNQNGDGFKQADLEWALDDHGIFTPDRPGMLDDGHDTIGYGAWTRSFQVLHSGHFAIQTEGAIWAWKYPEFAKMVTNYYLANTLGFSMMCAYEVAECSECGERFANTVPQDSYCTHLKERRTNGVTRWLRYPRFLTNSRVDSPADADADGLIVASGDEGDREPVADFKSLPTAQKLQAYYSTAKFL